MKSIIKLFIRILESLVIFVITISLVFALLYLIPGRIALAKNVKLSQENIDVINQNANYSGKFLVDYGHFIKNVFTMNFGISAQIHPNWPVSSFMWDRMLISFTISGIAVLLSLLISIPIAIFLARKPGKIVDSIGMFMVSIFIAIPSFIVAVLLIMIASLMHISVLFDTANISTWILPIVSLTLAPTMSKVVYLRIGLIESKNEQYVQFAKTKGIGRAGIEYKHILRISLFPIITYLPSSFLTALLGSMLVENIFGIPGAGKLLATGIQTKDFSVVQSIIVVQIGLVIISFLIRDVLYKLIDPRVR